MFEMGRIDLLSIPVSGVFVLKLIQLFIPIVSALD